MIGRTLSHFELCEKLGEGGMGVVYKARDSRLDRMVAIKVLLADAVSNHDQMLRFVKEAKSASALNHPNIVTVYEIDATGEIAFIAMEYVEGQTLGRLVPPNGLRFWEALPYAIQIADALAAAHAAGIVHRDLKPANVMITGSGMVKVLDFGLAKLMERGLVQNSSSAVEPGATVTMNAPQTEEGTIVGTFAYMSPEQAQGKRIDARSDVFSFGAVLYEMLTGRRAFGGDTAVSTLAAILDREPKPLAELQHVPKELETVLARCLRKAPDRRFQAMADIKISLQEIQEEFESGKTSAGLSVPPKRTVGLRAFAITVAALAVLLALAAYGFWWTAGRKESAAQDDLFTRITSDSGLTTDPAISLDGKLIAYASDRSGRGDLDIWVQQTGGSAPIRVTSDEADEHEPAFSPDGNTLAFRSEREKGGIYVVSPLGGETRLIAKGGHDPCFSPDGTKIAFWTGAGVSASTPSQIYVAPAAGGGATEAQSELKYARHPIWTPDGKRLLFLGADSASGGWWTVEVNAEGASATVKKPSRVGRTGTRGFAGFGYPWGWFEERLVATIPSGDSTDLWTVPVSHENWRVSGAPQRLTSGVELAAHPSVAARHRVAFASLHSEINVWSLPADGNTGRVTGGLQQMTYGVAQKNRPVVSRDGKKLAFVLADSRTRNLGSSGAIVVKDVGTGNETTVTTAPALYPSLSADGSKIAYSRILASGKVQIHVASLNGEAAEKVCDDCGLTPAAWSSDGRKLLYDWGAPQQVGLIDVVSRERVVLLRSADRAFTQASFSPDDHWICFLGGLAPGRNRGYIMAFRQGAPAPPESDWIALTDGAALEGLPRWSPDGTLIYFVSDRDGFRCLWAQRLDGNKKPFGPPFAVSHFHQARRSLSNVGSIGLVGLGVSIDRIAFDLGELTGNIWIAQKSESK